MKKIYISRMTIISMFILFLSICGTIACIMSINVYHHPQPLAYFSDCSLESGKYVSGTITSYVISPHKPKGTDFYDYFGNYDNIFNKYIGYIIPFNEEQYIRIWINDQKTLELLNETQDGFHVNVPFVGQVEDRDASQSEITDDMLGFDHNKLITNYVIVQEDLGTKMFWLKVCLAGAVISILLYYFKGKIEVSNVVYENKNPQSISRYADIPAEIAIVDQRIRMYEKLEKKYRKWSCIGVACIVIGVSLFVKFGSFSALVSFILLTGYGLSKLWTHFINSKNSLAVCIANLFQLRTLQTKRIEDNKLLADLKKKEDM